jgi:phytoene dehydrogenase-like protein
MTETYDFVIAGAGHNALILGCYPSKAGQKVCIAERNDKAGGSVATQELAGAGFKHDVCSVAHSLILGNPLMQRDELQLKSKYGLKYMMGFTAGNWAATVRCRAGGSTARRWPNSI